MSRFEILRSPATDVVIDLSYGLPAIAYWGSPLGTDVGATVEDCERVLADSVLVPGTLDVARRIPVVPLHGEGFPGRPGLEAHRRGGRHWSPRFEIVGHERFEESDCSRLVCTSSDTIAQVQLETRIALDADGVLSMSVTVRNLGDSPYMVDKLSVTIPFPDSAVQLAAFSGRWVKEFQFQRFDWVTGAWTAENRSGRTSHERPPFIWMLDRTASEDRGDVWVLHTAWSGNHVTYAEKLYDGRRYVQMGELFHPGEICLDPGDSLPTPDIIGAHSDQGFNGVSRKLHRHVRRISPKRPNPRLVHLNTWEAVYFDHDPEKLRALADVAASVGVERFVLDDGWFGNRRDDTRGLGDWDVSPAAHPQGLGPLIRHVTGLGMEFGIWVEPEMANPDSDLLRAHPDWVLATDGYEPVLGRNQVVLDLSRSDVFEHLFDRLDALLRDHAISYVKWDMNRPLVQASNSDGKSSSHRQVIEVYRLLDRLRTQHPHVEFESCASGGGRIDYEILRRVERVWTSDSNDAVERQSILHGASLVLPLEVLGSHIGPSPSHTTRRRHSMSFRAATALFGHFGIEADLTAMSDRERAGVARAVDVYKRFRPLLHTGDFVRLELEDDDGSFDRHSALAHAVVSQDRRDVLLSIAQIGTESSLVPGRVKLPGLILGERYRVEHVPLDDSAGAAGAGPGRLLGPAQRQPSWLEASWSGEPILVSGRILESIGLARPVMWPESAIVVHLSCA